MTWSDRSAAASPARRFRRLTPEARAATLVEAGFACLARGGITAFTVDNICREAMTSRGLIGHHFRSKDGLLAAVYAEAYRRTLAGLVVGEESSCELADLIERAIAGDGADPATLRVWLALWGEVAVNPELAAEHRKQYARYRVTLAGAIARLADRRSLDVDAGLLAGSLIALIDGLWLERCLAPDMMSTDRSRQTCHAFMEPIPGPLAD